MEGQLGNGTNTSACVPVPVLSLTGVVAVAGGKYHSLALKGDGTAWAWGYNYYGQLGNGSNGDTNLPAPVSGLAGVATLAAGHYHSLAALSTGLPLASLSTRSLAFGSQPLGNPSTPQSLTLTNTGAAALSLFSVTITGVHPGDFTKTADTCTGATLASAASCSITARFNPTALGPRNAAFLVTTNAPGSAHLVLLAGTGTSAVPLTVNVTRPNGGERLYTGTGYRIEWTTSGGAPLTSFDVLLSTNGGTSFAPVPGCSALPGTARNCLWVNPGPATTAGRIRVVARDNASATATDTSDANFIIAFGTAAITVTAPNTALNWGIGSTQQIKWSTNLGAAAAVNIDVSRDGGSTWNLVAASVPNTGTYNWIVTGPASAQARIRVTWANGPASDSSNVNFTIAAPYLTLSAPNSASGQVGHRHSAVRHLVHQPRPHRQRPHPAFHRRRLDVPRDSRRLHAERQIRSSYRSQ